MKTLGSFGKGAVEQSETEDWNVQAFGRRNVAPTIIPNYEFRITNLTTLHGGRVAMKPSLVAE